MRSKALAVVFITATATLMSAPSALAFEPSADPRGNFNCPDGEPVPGHPGYPGIETGLGKSYVNSGGTAAAAWSATVLFHGPLVPC